MKMILRPKKPINLQQPIIQDNLYVNYLSQNRPLITQHLQKEKHIQKVQQIKNFTKNIENINKIQYNININKNSTKNRKSSEYTENYEQKKLQSYNQNLNKIFNQNINRTSQKQYANKKSKQLQKPVSAIQKKKPQQKPQKAQEQSTKLSQQIPQNYFGSISEYSVQSQQILNNYLSLNNLDYTNFISNQFMNFNQQFFNPINSLNSVNSVNPWFNMNQFYKPNINMENIQYFPEEMLSGLYRQLKIYEDFNKQMQNSHIDHLSIHNNHLNIHNNHSNANTNVNTNAHANANTNVNTNAHANAHTNANENVNYFNVDAKDIMNTNGNININANISTKKQSYRKLQQQSKSFNNKQQKVIYKHQQTKQSKQTKQTIQINKIVQPTPVKKVFKRSTYHIAIAYSIYWDQLKKQGKLTKNIQDMDPTLPARRLKHPQLTKNQ